MYKVNDFVRIINKEDKNYNRIGKIIDIQPKTCTIIFIDESNVVYLYKNFTKFIPFKVGDTVKIISSLYTRDYKGDYTATNDDIDPRVELDVNNYMLCYKNATFKLTDENFEEGWIIWNECYWSNDLLILIDSNNHLNIF